MISFREFLLEKNALTKHLEKGGDREKVFRRAKSVAQSAWLKNKKKKNPKTDLTIADAPDGIKQAQNYSELLQSISSWKDADEPIYNGAYSTITSIGKSLDNTSDEGKERFKKFKDEKTSSKQDTETTQDVENDQDVDNQESEQGAEDTENGETSQDAETSQDTDAEQLQKEVQQHLDKEYEKERDDEFKKLLDTADAQNINVANAKEKQTKKDAADVIFQAQKDYQLARKKVLEALSELIKLLFNDVDTNKITSDADKQIEKITKKQAMQNQIKELPKKWDKQIKAKEDFYEELFDKSETITNSRIEKINVEYPDYVKDMKVEHKQKRDGYIKTLRKEIEEKNKDNEKYQQFKELGNKKALELTDEERNQLKDLNDEFGIDTQLEEWDKQNKLDNEEIEKMTKEWRERQIAQEKASLENHIQELKAKREGELQKLKAQKDEMLAEIDNCQKILDRGGDETKVSQGILKMTMNLANVKEDEEETEEKEEKKVVKKKAIKEHFEKLHYECQKRLYEKKIDKEYKKLLRHFL